MSFFEEERVTPEFSLSPVPWGPLGVERVREARLGVYEGRCSQRGWWKPDRASVHPPQQACTMPGFGDPSGQAATTMALVGFPQRFGEHGQELGPRLRALITTERFEQRSDRTSLAQEGAGQR